MAIEDGEDDIYKEVRKHVENGTDSDDNLEYANALLRLRMQGIEKVNNGLVYDIAILRKELREARKKIREYENLLDNITDPE